MDNIMLNVSLAYYKEIYEGNKIYFVYNILRTDFKHPIKNA